MYALGEGVQRDYAEAARWYRRAAEQGNAQAQYWLGRAYALGEGVTQNFVDAHMWLNLAATYALRASDAAELDRASRARDGIAQKMTPAQLAEAQRLAREFKPK